MMKTIAVCNQKGGVGKSTICYHVADALSRRGLRVLVVDDDPQGNITLAMAESLPLDAAGLADVLSARSGVPLEDVVVGTHMDGVDLVPTVGEALTVVRDELVIAGAGRESRLAAALASVSDRYDVCLIDCPPALDQLTINALVAAGSAVVVTHARLWSAQGLGRLVENAALVRDAYNPKLKIKGIVLNQVERTTSGARHWMSEVGRHAEAIGAPVLWPEIPKRVAIADSVERGASLPDAELRRRFDSLAARMIGATR